VSLDDEDLFAMKVATKGTLKRQKDQDRMAVELKVMRDLPPSRFLERCHAAFESATDVFFVCDYIAGGDLFYHMSCRMEQGKWGFEESECKVLLAEVTLGLEHLHDHGFIHRDLKVENIMLTSEGHVKLIDFGLTVEIAKGKDRQPLSPTGSLIYMAPELVKSTSGGRHTDWWAMGILAFELMTGRTPWSSLDHRPTIRHEIQNCTVLVPDTVSDSARRFVRALLHLNFRARLGTSRDSDVKRASFFAGVDWQAMARGETAPAFVCGVAKVDPRDTASALDAYTRKTTRAARPPPRSPSASFSSSRASPRPPLAPPGTELATGAFGVRSLWFLETVDVVTRHPEVEAT
jgi:protein-serine/threonine kinase